MSIRVIHSIPQWLGQTLTWLYNQVRFLPPEIESHVVCSKTANLDQFGVPNIHALIAREPMWLQYTQKALRLAKLRTYTQFLEQQAREIQTDILHSHFGNIAWENMPVAKKLGLKHIVTFYGRDVNYLPQQDSRWRERYVELFASVDRVLCEGTFMAAEIVKLGCPAEKVQVQHLGVDIEKMVLLGNPSPPAPLPSLKGLPLVAGERGENARVGGDIERSPTASKIEFHPRVWQPGMPLRVLMAASFQEKKGFPYALEALARVKDEIPLEITLIGDAADSDDSRAEKQKILSVIEKNQLQVKMPGYVPYARLMDEAYAHHVFLSPSVTASTGDTEGGAPVALIDMTASGMMVVSSTHCDIPQIVLHGQTGLLAGERDVEGLANHLRWLVANPGAWAGMLAAGRAHVEAEYNAAVQGRRLAEVYGEVVG